MSDAQRQRVLEDRQGLASDAPIAARTTLAARLLETGRAKKALVTLGERDEAVSVQTVLPRAGALPALGRARDADAQIRKAATRRPSDQRVKVRGARLASSSR